MPPGCPRGLSGHHVEEHGKCQGAELVFSASLQRDKPHPSYRKDFHCVGPLKAPRWNSSLRALLSNRQFSAGKKHAPSVSAFVFRLFVKPKQAVRRKQCDTAISQRTRAALQFLKRNLRSFLDKWYRLWNRWGQREASLKTSEVAINSSIELIYSGTAKLSDVSCRTSRLQPSHNYPGSSFSGRCHVPSSLFGTELIKVQLSATSSIKPSLIFFSELLPQPHKSLLISYVGVKEWK